MEPVVKIEGLTKVFRRGFFLQRVLALEGLDLEIDKGEIFGYLGPNGAGKTTTMKLLVGLIFPTNGNVLVWGQAPWKNEVKAKIGFLPENPYFYDYLKVRELLQFYGRIFGLDRRELNGRIGRLLERLGLTKELNTPLRHLSKGNIQRVGLAQALLNDPDLLILDEPMSGLDPIGRREVRDLILQLRDEGKTILFSTHILSDVETICHRVGILVKGKIRKIGPLSDLMKPRVIGYEVTARALDPDTMSLLENRAVRLVGGREQEAMVEVKEDDVEAVLEILRQRGAKVLSLIPKKEGLEEVFLKEVERADGDGRDHSHSLFS